MAPSAFPRPRHAGNLITFFKPLRQSSSFFCSRPLQYDFVQNSFHPAWPFLSFDQAPHLFSKIVRNTNYDVGVVEGSRRYCMSVR